MFSAPSRPTLKSSAQSVLHVGDTVTLASLETHCFNGLAGTVINPLTANGRVGVLLAASKHMKTFKPENLRPCCKASVGQEVCSRCRHTIHSAASPLCDRRIMASFEIQVQNGITGELLATPKVVSWQLVIELKSALSALLGTPPHYQKLVIDGLEEELSDSKTLDEIGVKDGTTIKFIKSVVQASDFVNAIRDGIHDIPLLSYMAANGANVNHKASEVRWIDASALHFAAQHCFPEVCKLLIDCCTFTEVNSTTRSKDDCMLGVTPLHIAIMLRHEEICCVLLDSPKLTCVPDPFSINFDFIRGVEQTALDIACELGLPDAVRALSKHPLCTPFDRVCGITNTTILMRAASHNTPGNEEVCTIIMADKRFTLYHEEEAAGGGTAYSKADACGLRQVCDKLKEVMNQDDSCNEALTHTDMDSIWACGRIWHWRQCRRGMSAFMEAAEKCLGLTRWKRRVE